MTLANATFGNSMKYAGILLILDLVLTIIMTCQIEGASSIRGTGTFYGFNLVLTNIYTFLLGLWIVALSKAQRHLAGNSVKSSLVSTKKIFSPCLSMTFFMSSDSICDAFMLIWRSLNKIMISKVNVMAQEGKCSLWKSEYWKIMYFNHP